MNASRSSSARTRRDPGLQPAEAVGAIPKCAAHPPAGYLRMKASLSSSAGGVSNSRTVGSSAPLVTAHSHWAAPLELAGCFDRPTSPIRLPVCFRDERESCVLARMQVHLTDSLDDRNRLGRRSRRSRRHIRLSADRAPSGGTPGHPSSGPDGGPSARGPLRAGRYRDPRAAGGTARNRAGQ